MDGGYSTVRLYFISIIFTLYIFVVIYLLTGCVNPSTHELQSLTDLLNKADRKTCIYYTGNAGPYLSIHGITALGDVDFITCLNVNTY